MVVILIIQQWAAAFVMVKASSAQSSDGISSFVSSKRGSHTCMNSVTCICQNGCITKSARLWQTSASGTLIYWLHALVLCLLNGSHVPSEQHLTQTAPEALLD